MAGIILDVGDDIKKLQQLRSEIEKTKKALEGMTVNVNIDIKADVEAKLKSLTKQYNTLASSVAAAGEKVRAETEKIKKATEDIASIQEKTANTTGKGNSASVENEAKAYGELKGEIDRVLGTRNENIAQMVKEMNAIRLINAEIKMLNNERASNGILSQTQTQRLQQLNSSLLVHKTALSDIRREVTVNTKLNMAAAGSMEELSQSLARMRITYRGLNDEERNSPFGKNLLASIQQSDAQIKELDASIGNHQRNVGNYASGFSGLNMSVQQIVRELPSAAMGLNTFFLAISNNLPILIDEIKRAKAANEELKASGKTSTPVWKQVAGSLLSWQTAMMVGISLLTMYGKDIINWIAGLSKAKTAVNDLAFAHQQLRDASKEAQHEAVSEQTKLKVLYATATDTNVALKDRITAVEELKKQYPSYFNKLSNEAILAGNAAGAYRQLASDILKAAQARALEKRIEKLSDRNIDLERYNNADTSWKNRNQKNYNKSVGSHSATDTGGARAFVPTGVDMSGGQSKGALETEWNKRTERLDSHTEELNRNNKAIQSMVNKVTSIKATEINLGAGNGGNTGGGNGGGTNNTGDALKDRKQAYKELGDSMTSFRKKNNDDEIALMEDGADKKKAEIQNDYEQQITEIQKQSDKFKGLNKKAGVSTNADGLTDNQSQQITLGVFTANAKRDASLKKIDDDMLKQQEASMDEYLKQYGATQEKKLAIARIYQKKISEATTKGDKLSLNQQLKSEIANIDFEDLKKSINWDYIFGNLDSADAGTLSAVKDQLQQFIDTAKDMPVEDIKTVTDAILNLQNKIDLSKPISSIKEAQKEFKAAKREYDAYKKSLDEANKKGDTKGAATATTGMTKASQKMSKAKEKEKKAFDQVTDIISEYAKALSEAGDIMGGAAGSCVKLAANTLLAGVSMAKGIKAFGDAVSTMEKSIAILAIIEAALQALQIITNAFGADYSEYDEMKEKYENLNKVWDELIEKKQKYIDISYGDEARAAASETEALINKKSESNVILGKARLNAGASAGSHSIGKRMANNTTSQDWKEIASALGWSVSDTKDYIGTSRMTGLFDLTAQQLSDLQEQAPTFWAKMDEQVKDYLQNIIDCNDQLEDMKDSLNETLTGVTFDSFYDSFVSTLSDMDKDSQDFADDFGEYLKSSILQNMLANEYKDKIKALYDSWAGMSDSNSDGTFDLTAEESAQLKAQQQALADEMIAERNNLASAFGWDGTDSQSATANSIENITADQADQLVGRITAVQIGVERGNAQRDASANSMSILNATVSELLAATKAHTGIADDIRTQMANSYLELIEINKNTGVSAKHLEKIDTNMADMYKIIKDKL